MVVLGHVLDAVPGFSPLACPCGETARKSREEDVCSACGIVSATAIPAPNEGALTFFRHSE